MPSEVATQVFELPTMESMLRSINRNLQGLDAGTITPAVANAAVGQISAAVRLVKLELEAAKLLNRRATFLPRMLGEQASV